VNQQDMTAYQAAELAELDKQLAVWGQRLQVLDQQINSVQQTINDSITHLGGQLVQLVSSADEWLLQAAQDTSTPEELVQKIMAMKSEIIGLGVITLDTNTEKLQGIVDDLELVSKELFDNLTTQASAFGTALDSAASDLSTHYGIQI
jgi:hypothetical protein